MPESEPGPDDQAAPEPVFHLGAAPAGAQASLPQSLCSTHHPAAAEALLLALAAAYPGHIIRVTTTLVPCDDDRVALRMLAAGRGISLQLT